MNYKTEQLQPFGILVSNTGKEQSIEQFSPEQIYSWLAQHQLLLFRGFSTMPKQDLALYAQKLGKPLQWVFGAINDLKVKADTENYIFTDHEVPMHWDGAFVKKIPHIILFQCITASRKEDMGGTTFANTQKILEKASPEELQEWEQISITYQTEKIVHYGGEITQQFIAKHEVNGKEVIRFAEPVDDLNPVKLTIDGLQKTPELFLSEIKKMLYHPDNLYTHRWEDQDIVLADNHTLLHGREAFKNQKERYIQRVNILHRPKKKTVKRFLENCLTIRRKEFFVAELPIFLIPLLLNIAAWNDFLQPMLYVGLLAIVLLFNIGDMINCYADYELDAIYKSHLSNAVYELGKKNVKAQIIVSGILALVLTVCVAIYTQQIYLIPLTIVGIFIGLQYSIKPFKFKSQGMLQLFCLWGIIFFGPMVYTAIITNGFPNMIQLMLFAFFGFHQMGIVMMNTAEDYTEDKAMGLNTIIVRLGFHQAMFFAFKLVILSGLILQLSLAFLFYANNSPWFLYLFIGTFTMGWARILNQYQVIINKIKQQSEEEAIKEIKKNGMKVPQWLKIGAYSFLLAIVAFFVWTITI